MNFYVWYKKLVLWLCDYVIVYLYTFEDLKWKNNLCKLFFIFTFPIIYQIIQIIIT